MKPMNMKNLSAKFSVAVVLFAMSAALLLAQNPTNASNSNAVTAQEEPSATVTNTLSISNSIPITGTKHTKSPDGAVRIDSTGIHVGGRQPVDITWQNPNGMESLGFGSFGKTLVALAAILCPFIFAFGLPVVLLVAIFYFRHRRNKMVHETVRAMIEKGMPISPELITQLASQSRGNGSGRQYYRSRRLLPGLVLTGVGLALLITGHWHSKGGLIVLFIGLAFLLVWLIERNQSDDQQPPKP
jgi:hypothetical protein